MEITYKLFRHSGYLFFNSFSDKERYWVSIQAAAQGGGSMYTEITEQEFVYIFKELCEVSEYLSRFKRCWEPELEQKTAERFNIREAIAVHNLAQYAIKPDKDGVYRPSKKPLKSTVTANKAFKSPSKNIGSEPFLT